MVIIYKILLKLNTLLLQDVQDILYYSLEVELLQNKKYKNYYMTKEDLIN